MRRLGIVLGLVGVILISSCIGFADTAADVVLRLGMFYGSGAQSSYKANFLSGMQLMRYEEGNLYALGNFPQESYLDIQKNNKYAVVAQLGFNSKEEADLLFYSRGLIPVGYYFNGNIRPIIGVFQSNDEAQTKLGELVAQFPDLSLNVLSPQSNQVLSTGLTMHFIHTDNSPFVFYDMGFEPFYTERGKTYRGGILVSGLGNSGTLSHINIQDVETYLYGVLPKEMAYNWPAEALKAQAVAARNYAIVNRNKHKSYGFDLCTTVDCQVYGGVASEKKECTQAVDATKHMLIYAQNNLISAFYHSNSGGATENSENVWSAFLGYIRGIVDVYSIGAPNSDWMLSYTSAELQAALLKSGYDSGTIYDVRVDKRTDNGRVLSVSVVGSKNTLVFEKEKFRSALGSTVLKSMLFEIQKGDKIAILSSTGQQAMASSGLYAISANGTSTVQMPFASYDGVNTTIKSIGQKDYTFVGHGYGHGLGMSQYGAKKMAELGYNYVDILSFYYNGVVVQ